MKADIDLVSDAAALQSMSDVLGSAVRIAVDTETHAASSFEDGIWSALRVISLAARMPDGSVRCFVVDWRDVPHDATREVFSRLGTIDGWNASFDDRVLRLAGFAPLDWRCAMLTDGLLHSGMSGFDFWHSLEFAARKYLRHELSGKGDVQMSYDGTTDLTEAQVGYAAQDALVTLQVAERVEDLVDAHGLRVPVDLEQAARPFVLEMTERGLPFLMDQWRSEVLERSAEQKKQALRELADLTGGSEMTLFGEGEGPSWNPDSDPQAREALNMWAADAVRSFNDGNLFSSSDKVDKLALKQIDHPLAEALLSYRACSKVLSTYGENLDRFIGADGRVHPRYKQGGVTATGRLASDRPNAQNFSPLQKPFFRPPPRVAEDGSKVERVFVYADLSQVELRVLAQESGDERMRELFRLGGDFHALTAADMFHIDMDRLKVEDPEGYSAARKKAKGVNFGIPYGLGAASLATSLTVNSGLETTASEAQEMLAAYAAAYPRVDAWLKVRDRKVKELSSSHGEVDWDVSLACYEMFVAASPVRKALKRRNGRTPSMLEVSEELLPDSDLEGDPSQARDLHVRKVRFALGFDAPVALRRDGTPWTFESRTRTGRRRLFSIPMDASSGARGRFEGVVTLAMLAVCTSSDERMVSVKDSFASQHGLDLPALRSSSDRSRTQGDRRAVRTACVKQFEGASRPLRYELLRALEYAHPGILKAEVLPVAFREQVRSMGNMYRNHPIQSLVADIGLQYYADLHERLAAFPSAYPVQAVHDSIVIECDMADAVQVRDVVKDAMESSLASWCPDVPSVADADIRSSLDDADVLDM